MGRVPVKGQDLPGPLWHGASSTRLRAWQGKGHHLPWRIPFGAERDTPPRHAVNERSEAKGCCMRMPTHTHTPRAYLKLSLTTTDKAYPLTPPT